LGEAEYTTFTVVIILNVGGRVIGMVVDSVSDVLELDPSTVRDAPEMSAIVDSSYILGLGTMNDRMLILVDIEKLLMSPEMAIVGA
jgi:purine-binding chemotaxis protein CheW